MARMIEGPDTTIVCLCGPTRFSEAYQKAQLDFTLAGEIVLTIGCNMRSDTEIFADYSDAALVEVKEELDKLHLRKIDLADKVFILNVGGYVGDSTRREIQYAKLMGKPVTYLEDVA